MLTAAHLSPPTTWAQLAADAKALTRNGVHGFAFSATPDENSTFQFEPYFWSNGADLSTVNSAAGVQALTLWATMVKDGSVSKSALQWPQFPDLYEQFVHGNAAMEENGPWILPALAAAGWKYGVQYGIVPIPVPSAGRKVVTPVGGETWALANSGDAQQQKLAWEWVQGLQQPSVMTHVVALMNYLPPKPAVATPVAKADPAFAVFAKELETARPRTTVYGANYAKVSQAISTAIQAAVDGSASPSAALGQAQATIATIPQVKGG
jgi:multiple sugar transport system substrate-binding protein